MLWIALHLPALSLEAWVAGLPPDQAGKPLALVQDHQLHLVDARAWALGLRPGMKRATAQALAPDVLLGQADAQRDARALVAVAHVALGFSPAVAWATPAGWRPSPTEAAGQGLPPQPSPSAALVGVRLEVQSCLRYFGGLAKLLERLRAALAPLQHRVQLATAPTALGAALLAAHSPLRAERQARQAGDQADRARRAGPAGRADEDRRTRSAAQADQADQADQAMTLATLQRRLAAAPLHLLGLDMARQQALQAMGLFNVADLASLPRDGLARRLGPELLTRLDQAHGRTPEAHQWLSLPPTFDSRLELFARADTSAQVLTGARILLTRLVAWAGARQARVCGFELVMHHEPRHRADSDSPTHTTLDIQPAQASADADHLLSLLTERLGRLPLPAPALELSLHCHALAAGGPPNGELFASPGSQQEGLVRLVERLQARLGPEQVQRLSAVADHRPEHATCWQPVVAGQLASSGASLVVAGAGQAALALPSQPLWLLPQPQALTEHQQRPQWQGGPLQLLAGPERLETGWWDGDLAVRDYFIAQAAGGTLVWVFRARLPGDAALPGWFLHGLFA